MNTIITIGRQFGSGGREIGIRLAKALNVPFYDKELLRKAAEKSGLCEKIFENFDERPKSLLYSIAMDSYLFSLPGAGASDSLEQKVYLATYDAIRHVADEGPCVLIGRCADYILRNRPDVVRVFVHADPEFCVEQAMKVDSLPENEVRKKISEIDDYRARYYKHHTGHDWYDARNYDLSINSGVLGFEGVVEEIVRYMEVRSEFCK